MAIKNRKGFVDITLFIVATFVIVTILVSFKYMSSTVREKLTETAIEMDSERDYQSNITQLVDTHIGAVDQSFNSFVWISELLIIGMIIAMFIGSYLVNTRPVFFVPFMILMIVAIIISVGLSNGYEQMTATQLNVTASRFVGANWFMDNLPMVTTIVGFTGGIIMFTQMLKAQRGGYI